MKKKQMLATLVMLSLLQGSVYAETVDNFTLNAANPTKSFNEDTIVTGRVKIEGGNYHDLVGTINVNNGQGTLTFTSGRSIRWDQGGTVIVNASSTIFTGSNSYYTFEKDSNQGTLNFFGDLIFKDLTSKAVIKGGESDDISAIIAAGDISFNNVSTDEQVASLQAVSLIGKNITADNVHQTSYDMVGTAFWVHRGVLQATGEDGEGGTISVKNSSFEHGSYGDAAIWADNAGQVLANDVVVDNIEFLSSTGRDKSNYVGSGIHAENGSHVMVGEKISVENITGSTINVAGIDLEGQDNVGGITPPGASKPEEDPPTLLQTGEIYINGISSKTEGLNAFGIRALGLSEKAEGLKIQANKLTVNDVAGTFAYGFAQLNAAQAYFDEAEIANINGTMEGAGVYLLGFEGNSEVEFGKLKIHDISVEEGGLISLANVSQGVLKADVAELFTNNNLAYHGSYAEDASSDEVKIDEIGLRSVAGGLIDFTNENGSYTIVGNLVAGYGSELPSDLTESTIDGGKITINGKNTQIYGDVFAGNGGEINITLNSGNILEGQVDDYHELASNKEGDVFHNSAFVDSQNNPLDVVAAGKATLNINDGGEWIARGQSFVDTVTLDGGTIDMSKNENSSVTVNDLSGSGIVKMHLNTGDRDQSDMLYVTGSLEGNYELQIAGDEFDINEITEDNPLRFATVKGDVNTENLKARAVDAGFFNNEYTITKENFAVGDDENVIYNNSGVEAGGDHAADYKPGNDYIESTFDAADTNLLIGGVSSQTVSDAGKTIINMSRANYSNAIYMDRLNKRMGETRYINPEEEQGMWVRLRHDRIGKTDAFRSQNTMYEMGYDIKQDCDNGERRIGMAIDYMDGKTEYRNVAGDGDIKRYGLWLYDTWTGNKGHYTDFVAKWGHLENDFEIYNSLGKVNGDYSNNVFSVSAEYGKKNDMGSGWYFEPQAQLQLARVTGADYVTSQNTKVSLDGINSLIGRAGFRLGRDLDENSTVYVKADLLHEFLGDQTISAYDITTNGVYCETFENKGTWYDVGFGFATALGKNSYAFMDFEKSFGNDNDETYQVNAGVQWTF